jgi:hypothetical protein
METKLASPLKFCMRLKTTDAAIVKSLSISLRKSVS